MKTSLYIFNKIQQCSYKKFIIPLFVIFVCVLVTMEMSTINYPILKDGMLDMKSNGYTPESVYNLLNSIGFPGRQVYSRFLIIDFIFIIIFMLLLSLVITFLIGKAGLGKRFNFIILLPFLRSVLDIIENCFILTILSNFPNKLTTIAAVSSLATVSKFVVLYAIIVVLVGLGVFISWKSLKLTNWRG